MPRPVPKMTSHNIGVTTELMSRVFSRMSFSTSLFQRV